LTTDIGRTAPDPQSNGSAPLPNATTQQPEESGIEQNASDHPWPWKDEADLAHNIQSDDHIILKSDIIHARTGMGRVLKGTECVVTVPPRGTPIVGVRPVDFHDVRRWFYVKLEEVELVPARIE
jgi:hypothetical protein